MKSIVKHGFRDKLYHSKKIIYLADNAGETVFDRILMDYYGIKDLRELYSNNLNKLRRIK